MLWVALIGLGPGDASFTHSHQTTRVLLDARDRPGSSGWKRPMGWLSHLKSLSSFVGHILLVVRTQFPYHIILYLNSLQNACPSVTIVLYSLLASCEGL